MSYNDIPNLSNEDLHDLIKKGVFADQFKNSELGQMIEEAGKRILNKVDRQLAFEGVDLIDKKHFAKLVELLVVKEKWQYGFFSELDLLITEGHDAYDELQHRRESVPTTDVG